MKAIRDVNLLHNNGRTPTSHLKRDRLDESHRGIREHYSHSSDLSPYDYREERFENNEAVAGRMRKCL